MTADRQIRLSTSGAAEILRGFDEYTSRFREINTRARARFEQRDWAGLQADAVERLRIYPEIVADVVASTRSILGEESADVRIWAGIKASVAATTDSQPDRELIETFHNSVTRRIFHTVGVDPSIEFVDTGEKAHAGLTSPDLTVRFGGGSPNETLDDVLQAFRHEIPYAHLESDVREIGQRLEARMGSEYPDLELEMVDAVFYRGQAAYLVGRAQAGETTVPIAIALRNSSDGILTDAVLLSENEVSILFSFTRSYFHVRVDDAGGLVRFLSKLMPRKRIAELYISIGQNRHGKTELYRDLLRHVESTEEKFEHAPGTKGMVMIVFTMPGYDDVFKVIRDRFPLPKRTTRASVIRKYQLVFQHDRAGRLMDVQDFQHLEFGVDRFTPELLEELTADAGNSVSISRGNVILHHVYVERRIVPLDVLIREADPGAAEAAVLDYGQAIKDLASTNIFPGDLLIKNFGVTRHGRVVFYDYDELSTLTEVHFRRMPEPRDDFEAMSDQPWYAVGDRDIFPEEHRRFLGMKPPLREVFVSKHGDLFEVEPWTTIQRRIESGEIIEVFPYTQGARLPGTSRFRGW
jgi:isocitrate dehydrogenase kinase/phosphatase